MVNGRTATLFAASRRVIEVHGTENRFGRGRAGNRRFRPVPARSLAARWTGGSRYRAAVFIGTAL